METIEDWVRLGQKRLDRETDEYLEEDDIVDEDKDDSYMDNLD